MANYKHQHGGAAEAFLDHNPEIVRSKLPPASFVNQQIKFYGCSFRRTLDENSIITGALNSYKIMFMDILNHVADFSAKISKLTNTENDKTLFPDHFLLIRIVFFRIVFC